MIMVTNQNNINKSQPPKPKKRILPFRKTTTELNRIIIREDWIHAQKHCISHPHQVKTWSNLPAFFDRKWKSTVLPLHQVCALQPSEDVVRTLVKAYPRGVQEAESTFGRLALHVACRSKASLGVVKILLEYYPRAAEERDNLGRIPLHYALSNGADLDVVQLLLDANEKSVKIADENGWLALHVACHSGCSTDVIEMLMERYPNSVVEHTKDGRSPLNCSLLHRCSKRREEIRELLVRKEEEMKASSYDDIIAEGHLVRRKVSFKQSESQTLKNVLDNIRIESSSSFMRMM